MREERAYLLLEEARLLCERLRARCDEDAPHLMGALHRELGLAGFFASSNIRALRRHALLDRARARAADQLQRPPDVVRALEGLCRLACDVVEDALGLDVLSDHMHLAHVHLLSGQQLLRAAHTEDLLRGLSSPLVSALTGDAAAHQAGVAEGQDKGSSADGD